MKRNQDPSVTHDAQNPSLPVDEEWSTEQEKNDPVWNLLGQASSHEPSAFFARDIVRATRQIETPATLSTRIISFFTPVKLTLAAAACVCAMATYQMWPSPDIHSGTEKVTSVPVQEAQEPSLALSDLVIDESLAAAADDPTLFTHDEVVAMIGF